MHIKSIIIDGFKSYAKRTEITGFDPAFNAITGLNGSGKSNILDAICFLLGITNLSQVRAANLQDLVYKSGQAGITTASVSIIFDNREKSSSPIGYEEYDELTVTRQIVVGGKNKYLINGNMNPNNRVQDLFRSVQLNVNNPHFLIMQGRITKVLNMKPPEILSLLEEAANTKHYESKREETLKTIEKKEGKLREIDKILNEDIKPTLAKLKRERTSYLEYQKVVRDLEYLNKFLVAYDYSNMKAIVDNADGEYNRLKDQLNHEEERIKQCDQQKLNLEETIDKLCEERDNVHLEKMQNMQTEFAEMQKQEAILKNSIKRAEEEVKEAKSNVASLKKQLKEDGDNQSKTKSEISKIQGKFEELKEKVEKSKLNCENAQQRLQEVNSGFFISETGNATGSLAELLAAAEKEESDLAIELNGLKMRLKHITKVFEEISNKLEKTDKSDISGKLEKKQANLSNEIEKLESQANNIGFSQLEMEKSQNELVAANAELRRVTEERQNFIRRNQRLEFVYDKPSKTFDTRKIIGMVSSLVTLSDMQFSLALEIAAGGRLYNVIIDHDSTGAELFEKNCLPNRTTLLPLNKMNSSPIPESVVKRAKSILGEDNVWSPMEIINYDKSYHSAIGFVFGTFLIARTLNMAKEVAFNRQINCKCVTLDGEIFDPEGTLVGGNRPVDTKIFENAHHLSTLDKSIGNLKQNRDLIEENLTKMSDARNQFNEVQGKLRACTLELRQLERQMMGDRYLDVKNEHSKTKAELESINRNLTAKEKVHRTACDKTKVARENLANSASIQENAQKTAAANLKSAQEQLQKAEDSFKDIESRYETLTLECKENEQERNNLQSSIETAEITVTEKVKISETASSHLVEHVTKIKEFKVGLDEIKRILRGVENRISECQESVKECGKTKDQAALKVSDLSHRISTHRKDSEDAEKKLKKLLSKYNWILEESKHFNQPGGIYDFNNRDWKGAKQKIEQLEDEKRKLSRKIDLRGMNVLGQTEERYNDLMLKYQKVLQDKQVLQNVIDELDKLKDDVVKKAHEQVDRDFDKIFSTLLPGSQARLIPPEGKTLSDGLEFKIAFGNVWKDSLNELSGGQRSLVALSLILALLRFKPAPLYILDEVDAALDVSHTQNIGTIIKEQFSNSQFIIVSLKDGMFNNANVLFKTKFVDGISTVSRQVNTNRRPMAERNI